MVMGPNTRIKVQRAVMLYLVRIFSYLDCNTLSLFAFYVYYMFEDCSCEL